jgi:hypothetical protein
LQATLASGIAVIAGLLDQKKSQEEDSVPYIPVSRNTNKDATK